VFEHADSLAADTQAFLRRMLETTSATTRIVFECKDAGAISEPILSRSTIVTVNAPDTTEINYELQRRTDYKLSKEICSDILTRCYGNMRIALMNGLRALHCADGVEIVVPRIQELLHGRPMRNDVSNEVAKAWMMWAIRTEVACRQEGLDLRDVLRLGWPSHPVVANTCARWSRLGGTSPRTLFFDCLASLIGAV
jgi:DNA polymerase III delta prime subunit